MTSPSKKCRPSTQGSVDHKNLYEKGKEIDNHFDLPYLPTPILFDILSRLQIKTLFNCRLVCKRWTSIISTSQFSQLHLLKSPTSCLIQRYLNYDDDDDDNVLHLLDPEYPCTLENKFLLKPKINFPNFSMVICNSCNGLVCLVQLRSNVYDIYVCNPILRVYITLPNPPVGSITCLFGFSQKANQYKVVVSYKKSHNMIYTCGEGSWKIIQSSPCRVENDSYNALVNGYLHWVSYSRQYPTIICCFDFDCEQFHVVPEPSEFRQCDRVNHCEMRVGVLNGNLSIFCTKFPEFDCVVIWVMKNYGEKESWCKDFVINYMFNDELVELDPIKVKGNGEILMIYDHKSLILYDTITKTFRPKQQIFEEDFEFHAIAYTPSLLSLKDVARGENIKVVGRN